MARRRIVPTTPAPEATTPETSAVPSETSALAIPSDPLPTSESLPPGATDFNPAEFETPTAIVNQVAEATKMPENGRAAPRQFSPAPDPFDIQSVFTDDNAVHLGNSHKQRAYFVHFDRKPEPGTDGSKHPALAALQDAGFK